MLVHWACKWLKVSTKHNLRLLLFYLLFWFCSGIELGIALYDFQCEIGWFICFFFCPSTNEIELKHAYSQTSKTNIKYEIQFRLIFDTVHWHIHTYQRSIRHRHISNEIYQFGRYWHSSQTLIPAPFISFRFENYFLEQNNCDNRDQWDTSTLYA